MFAYSESNFRKTIAELIILTAQELSIDENSITVDTNLFYKKENEEHRVSADLYLMTQPQIPNASIKSKRTVTKILQHFKKNFGCVFEIVKVKNRAARSNSQVVTGHFENANDKVSGCITLTKYSMDADDRISLTLIATFDSVS